MEDRKYYTSETLTWTVPMGEFMRDLVDVPRFLGYCRNCPNFGRYWSCPPFDLDPVEIWGRYGQLLLYARKVIFIRDRLFPGERRTFEREELPKIKGAMARELLALEAKTPGSLALFPGRCDGCSVCARTEGKPCRMPDRMRWSIEALGGDCGGALEKFFKETLRWASEDRLPEQMIFLGGLLLPADE